LDLLDVIDLAIWLAGLVVPAVAALVLWLRHPRQLWIRLLLILLIPLGIAWFVWVPFVAGR